jgi:hypothetical protein
MLKLLLGWGLALKDALVDEIRNVVHYVFAHPSRCAIRGRQIRRRSLRNSSSVLGCGVHVLGDAACWYRISLGLAPLDAKTLGVHSRSQALVLGPRRVGVFHRAEAHRPCALRIPALGERAPALNQVGAANETRSEEGFLDVGHELREELVRACRLDDEEVFHGVLLPLLGRGPDFNPGGCGCNGPRASWLGVA